MSFAKGIEIFDLKLKFVAGNILKKYSSIQLKILKLNL